MAQQTTKHTQLVDFSNPNADKIKSSTTTSAMAQQTATDWLWDISQHREITADDFEQALEMEKQQIADAWHSGNINAVTNDFYCGEQYYKETYKNK